MSDFDIDKNLDEMAEKHQEIPKERLRKVYNKILDRLKTKAPNILEDVRERMAFARLTYTIRFKHPVSFCPFCTYYTNHIRQLQSHLEKTHNRGKNDLEQVRKGFWARKDKKALDYTPKLS